MSRQNWAENFSNHETTLFTKGKWTVTEDREQVLSLYFDDQSIDPVSEYNKYRLFDKGFMLYLQTASFSSFVVYSANNPNPIIKLKGDNIQVSQDGELLTFTQNDNQTILNTSTLTKVAIADEDQLSFDL